MAVAVLGGGCFWCTEAVFAMLRGVTAVTPGYSGGDTENPSYEAVCSGTTGHAEVVKVEYDPDVIAYDDLLDVFFATHDPTTINQQGADIGSQYRSIIFYEDESQRRKAKDAIKRAAREQERGRRIVTKLQPAAPFYAAEAYHHDYFRSHRWKPYCQMVISPKLAKLKSLYGEKVQK